MDFMKYNSYQVLSFGTLSLFSFALVYFFYQITLLYFNRQIQVECWFCRTLTTVKAPDINDFFCSACSQYNGFTESGDYNRYLSAQFDERLNPSSFAVPLSSSVSTSVKLSQSDILCSLCTQKQIYKIEQLAQFEASCEANWEQELGEFKQELESCCQLCPLCTIKVHSRIDQIDRKILPSVLTWWRNRNQSDFDCYSSCNGCSQIFAILHHIPSFVRVSTALVWLSLAFSHLIDAIDYCFCQLYPNSTCNNLFQLSAFYIYRGYCQHLPNRKFAFAFPTSLTISGLIWCLLGHFALLSQTLHSSQKPFFTLVDAVLSVLAIVLLFKNISPGSTPLILLSIATVFTISGLIFKRFLLLNKDNVGLKNSHPRISKPPLTRISQTCNYDGSVSSRFSRPDTHSLSLDGLSLHSTTPSFVTSSSTIFSPSTLFPARSQVYVAGMASRFLSRTADNDTVSQFTSVSRCSGRRTKKQQGRRRSHQQWYLLEGGLLRWLLYFLFGRLESWNDVRVELMCLLNAVLVGILLILIYHLFFALIPSLWNLRL